MANDLTLNPLVFDTAAATVAVTSLIHISKIRWVDYNNDIADADQVIVQDKNGKPVWEARCTTVGAGTTTPPGAETDFSALPLKVNGLIVTTLTHGKLYIYLDASRSPIPVS